MGGLCKAGADPEQEYVSEALAGNCAPHAMIIGSYDTTPEG